MGLSGTKKGYNTDSGSGRFGNGCGGSSSLFMDQPTFLYLPVASLPYHSRRAPTCCRVHLGEDSKVDDPGCEVKGCLLAIVDHRDAMAVPIAGPGHATLEDGEGQPGRHRRVGGWAGAPDITPGSHRLSWQLGLPCDWPLDRGWEGDWFQVKCPLKVPRRGWGRPPSLPNCNSTGELGGEVGQCRLWVLSLCSHSCFNQSGPPFYLYIRSPCRIPFEEMGLLLKTV